jgi:zinc-ribbon domain
VPSCENCGAELPAGARFCPQCAAPVPPEAFDAVEQQPPASPNLRVVERVLFAILLLAFAGFVVFVVLVVGFGFLVEGAAL